MRTFLNHIKNETLDEIKTSLENFWQQMIQLSEFFQYSFVLILKRKCLVRASRVRSGESGTPSTIIYVRWSSRRYELGCDTPVDGVYSIRFALFSSVFCLLFYWWIFLIFWCPFHIELTLKFETNPPTDINSLHQGQILWIKIYSQSLFHIYLKFVALKKHLSLVIIVIYMYIYATAALVSTHGADGLVRV